MKIPGQIPQISGVYNKSKNLPKVDNAAGVASKRDVLSISNNGKDFQTALKAAKEAPDIRVDKVEEIKQKMQTDTYEVSGSDVADKVIKSILDREF